MTNSNTKVEAIPMSFTDVGTHKVKLVLTTVNEVVSFPFNIIVTNTPPHFIELPKSPIYLYLNDQFTIDITGKYIDDEGHEITKSFFY